MNKITVRLSGVAILLGFAGALQGLLAWTMPVQGQPPAAPAVPVPAARGGIALPGVRMAQVPPTEPNERRTAGRVTLPFDRSADRKIEQVKEWIAKEQWRDAVFLLQNILNSKEDVVLQNEKGRWVSVRFEANRLLGEMPRDGQQFYELEYGTPARNLLKKGLATGDPKVYADVAMRHQHTEAGADASQLLGTYYLDQGCYILAALCFEQLLSRPGMMEKASPLTLYKAAVAYERAADKKNRDRMWNELLRKLDQGTGKPLPAILQRMDQDRLKASLALNNDGRPARSRYDWPVFLGSIERSAQGEGGTPFLDPRQVFSTVTDPQTKQWLESAEKPKNNLNQVAISGYHPIAVGDMLIYRSYSRIHAFNIKSSKEVWYQKTAVGLDDLASQLNKNSQTVPTWAAQYLNGAPSLFYDNSTLGTLSTDNARVYAIEDLAIPMHPNPPDGRIMIGRPDVTQNYGDLQPWMRHNKLVAYEMATEGMLYWELPAKEGPDEPFTDTFFLGAPLPLADRLYALAETNGEIRLLSIDPAMKSRPIIEWSQALCTVDRKVTDDPIRRTQATHLAYGDGVLVCPTNAGAVIGVDLLTRSLLWAYAYHEESTTPPIQVPLNRFGRPTGYSQVPLTQPAWTSSAPMVRDGMVVFTAPDGESVHCLNLRDGTLAWKAARGNDLYLAGVFRGKVLLVGRETCRALNLTDGSEVWKTETGAPSGRGVANGTAYFLPLSFNSGKSSETRVGEVWTLDIDTGSVVAKSRASKTETAGKKEKGELPGNLVFHDGYVLSQNTTAVMIYPQSAVLEREITASLAKDPKNPQGLLKRGEYRMHQGELGPAVEDLRAALQNNLPEEHRDRARSKLYEALGDLLERNFANHENLLSEYQQLSVLPVPPTESDQDRAKREGEQRDRQARLLRYVAKGREDQGRVKEAFQAYVDFANLGREELVSLPDDPSTRALPKVWAQGRIEAMLRKATPEQKQLLDAAVLDQWQQAQNSGTLESLRQFVTIFGSISPQGRKSKLNLAERLMESPQTIGEAEAELQILVRENDADMAAPALEALARLNVRLGELESAARCYRTLAQKYPKVIVRDGKTGEELYLELATDKRFLPYVEELRRGWSGNHTIVPQLGTPSLQDGGGMATQVFWLEPLGVDAQPFARRYRLGIDNSTRQLKIADRVTGTDRPLFTLQGAMPVPYLVQNQAPSRLGLHYYIQGKTVVFAWGTFVYAFDRQRDSRPLWSYDLVGGGDPASRRSNEPMGQLQMNANGRVDMLISNNLAERVGTIGAVQPTCVCFLVRNEGLVAVDLLTGKKRWAKSDVGMNTEVFSDGQHLYLIPPGQGDRAAAKGLAIRITDGTPIAVPEFASLYQKKLQVVGRNLLLRDADPTGAMQLRLYDVHSGENLWSRKLDPQAVLVNSLTPRLIGLLHPSGKLTAIQVETGEDVLEAAVDPVNTTNLTEAHLLQDDSNIYLALNAKDPNAGPLDRIVAPPGPTLRSAAVNGPVYAFDRTTGQPVWRQTVPYQMMVTDQFEDLPLLLFASYQTQRVAMQGLPNQFAHQQSSSILALDKRDGKNVYGVDVPRGNLSLHTLKVDLRTGQVDLVGYGYRLSFLMTSESAGR